MSDHKELQRKTLSKENVVSRKEDTKRSSPRLQDNRPVSVIQKGKILKQNIQTDPVQKKANSTGLPDQLKNGIENLSGHSMDDVKVHYHSGKPAGLQAHAYAQGSDIHLASGQEKHLPHEAWHVVQQKQGRVKPTMQMKGNIYVNNDPHLENEADVMGSRAHQYSEAVVQPKSVSPLAGTVIQRQEVPARINGLTHLVTAKNGSIFEGADFLQVEHGMQLVIDTAQKLRSRRGPNQELHTEDDRSGPQNNRWFRVLAVNGRNVPPDVYVRADTIEVENAGDIAPSRAVGITRERPGAGGGGHVMGGPVGGLTQDEQRRWDALGRYTMLTVAAPEARELSKVENFDHALYPAAAQQYIDQFTIISRRQFQNKINEIALGVMRVGAYSCIISEVGKSNFWLTGKVLDQVRRLGGRPPIRVISLPVKEKGILDSRTAGQYAGSLAGAGHIVFIDDGSYSGSQLVKFINHVIGTANIPHSMGLVASTDHATHAIRSRHRTGLLAMPHRIETFEENMNAAYTAMGLPLHRVEGEPPDGNALAALHYKVPDYASVRHALLVGGSGRPGPIHGYSQGRGVPVTIHGRSRLAQQDGTEPYKTEAFLRAIAATRSLEELGIEDPTARPTAATAGSAAASTSTAFRGGRAPRPHSSRASVSMSALGHLADVREENSVAEQPAAAAAVSTSAASRGGLPPRAPRRVGFAIPISEEDEESSVAPSTAAAAASAATTSGGRRAPRKGVSFADE